MSLLGVTIVIATFSIFCFRYPPTSWSLLRWVWQPALEDKRKGEDAPRPVPPEVIVEEPKEDLPVKEHKEGENVDKTQVMESSPAVEPSSIPAQIKSPEILVSAEGSETSKEEQDRKAMPPPPFTSIKKAPAASSSLTTPQGAKTTTVPTLNIQADLEPAPTASFPALNSAQRASGGRVGPPRLPPVSNFTSRQRPISPLPNRNPTASTQHSTISSLAPPPTHTSIPAKPRKKVMLEEGHSALDWSHLTQNPNANLRGLPPSTPYLRVPPSLLKEYNGRKGTDAWTVLSGKVYNITPYLPFHPGGKGELLRCAGKDGTKLFGEIHPWINYEGLLEACLIGIAVEEGYGQAGNRSTLEDMD